MDCAWDVIDRFDLYKQDAHYILSTFLLTPLYEQLRTQLAQLTSGLPIVCTAFLVYVSLKFHFRAFQIHCFRTYRLNYRLLSQFRLIIAYQSQRHYGCLLPTLRRPSQPKKHVIQYLAHQHDLTVQTRHFPSYRVYRHLWWYKQNLCKNNEPSIAKTCSLPQHRSFILLVSRSFGRDSPQTYTCPSSESAQVFGPLAPTFLNFISIYE